MRVSWQRDLSWDFAKADMTLHPGEYTLEQKLEIMRNTAPRFGRVEVELEPVAGQWMGYSSTINVLCVRKE
jgi:hypothetical protein